MRLMLIRPNMGRLEGRAYDDEGRMEPLELAVLAGLTPPNVEIELIDDRIEAIPYDDPVDLVAITVETFKARRAYEISAEFRRRGVTVVMGGFHATLLPEEVLRHADAIVLNDAESVWRELLADARDGKLKPIYSGQPGTPQSNVLPRRDLFRGKDYLPISLAQFARGCRNACNYCAISAYFQQSVLVRPVEEVVREIETLERKLVFFVDDNIVGNPDAAKRLFRALIPLRIRWVSQACIDMVYDTELMELMVASGCLGNVIGFESINPQSLREMHKTSNLQGFDGYEREVQILRSYGLQTWAAFLVGHDADTPESLYQTLDFAKRNKFTFAAFNILMPYPNTPLYEKLRAEGRLLYDGAWWTHPDYRFNHAAFKPAQMTADELTEIAFDLRRRWNSIGSVVRRFFEPKTNMRSFYRAGIYWAYNPLFRREVFKKQGMRLGAR